MYLPSPPLIPQSLTPAALAALSPSTSTHQPSPPPPPSPPTATFSQVLNASSRISSSKVPGCNQTPRIPKSFASSKTFFVTAGGVIIDTEVCLGFGSDEREGRVGYSCLEMVMEGAEGLIGVAGMERDMYHAKTLEGLDFERYYCNCCGRRVEELRRDVELTFVAELGGVI